MASTVTFNPNEVKKPVVLIGDFPAHISQFEKGNPFNGGIPYNTEVVFDSCEGLTGQNVKGDKFDASHMAGARCQGETAWFNPNPGDGKGWKNRRFYDWCTAGDYQFPERVEDDQVVFELAEVEEKDIWGAPVIATVKLQGTYKDGKRTVYVTVPTKETPTMEVAEAKHKLTERGVRLYPTVVKVIAREGERLNYEEKLLADLEAGEGKKESAEF